MNHTKNGNGNGAIATVGYLYNGHTAEPTYFETKLMESTQVTGLSVSQSRQFIEYLAQSYISMIAYGGDLTKERAILGLYLEYLDSQK